MVRFLGLLCALGVAVLCAKSGEEIAKELNLVAGEKATPQWERIFEKRSKWEKFGLEKLSDADREALKKYLIDHAADSDRPTAAGM